VTRPDQPVRSARSALQPHGQASVTHHGMTGDLVNLGRSRVDQFPDAGVVIAVGGPLGDMYLAHVTAFLVVPAAYIALAQVAVGAAMALLGFRGRAG
jgi:hypothetical protein